MTAGTKIEWAEETWNPLVGCSIASAGCGHCYAVGECWRKQSHPNAKIAEKFAGTVRKTDAGQLVWTGKVNFSEDALLLPLRWKRPRRIFVNSLSDLFHESVPDAWIDRIFAVMALCPQHTFQVLTKRSARMREYVCSLRRERLLNRANELFRTEKQVCAAHRSQWPLPNVWLGVSVEDQARADERIPDLLAAPASVRWSSCEPLLGELRLDQLRYAGMTNIDALRGHHGVTMPLQGRGGKLDWIVAGGESGPGARPMHPDWARSLRDQCGAAGVPFFFKQWGDYLPAGQLHAVTGKPWNGPHPLHTIKKYSGRNLDGQLHNAFPQVSA